MTISKQDNLKRTITVAGHFGDLQLSKMAFQTRWCAHTQELRRLSCSADWQKTVDRMVTKTRTYARMEFETMYKDQQEKVACP